MTAQQWTLRALQQADLAYIVTSCWCDMPILQALDKIERVLRDVGRDRCWAAVVVYETRIIAYGQVTRWKTGAEIADLMVVPPWRQRGIGRALIQRLIVQAMLWQVDYVELGVVLSNTRARHLYSRLGFRPQYERATHPENTLYMRYPLVQAVSS